MKKISKTKASKVFNMVKDDRKEVEVVEFKLADDETVKVDVITNLPIADTRVIIKEVAMAAFIDNEYDVSYHYAHLAKCIIEYLTSLPTPTMKDADGNEVVDINLCYDLVFGKSGLVYKNEQVCDFIEELDELINIEIETKKANYTSTGKLCSKILDLYEISKRVIADVTKNPATLLNLVENMLGSEDAVSNVVDAMSKQPVDKSNVSVLKNE